MLRGLRAWQAGQPAPRRLVLVGHSLGSATILRALADPGLAGRFGDVLRQVEGAVLLAPADPVVEPRSETLEEFARTPGVVFSLGDATGILGRRVTGSVREGFADPRCHALRQERDRLLAVMCDRGHRRAGQAMVLRLVPRDPCGCPDHAAILRERAHLARIAVPCLLLWGQEDRTLPAANAPRLAAEIPGAELVVLAGSGHSPHVELPRETARRILDFADRIPRRVP
jgi:pimeloyl-ACP methyl ester carboxylesterase